MFKRAMVGLILAVSSTSVFADYFYVAPTITEGTITTSKSSYRGLSPRLSLGYNGAMAGCFSYMAEVFGSPFSIPLNNNKGVGSQSAKVSQMYGASFMPAYQLSDSTSGYFRFGILNAKFSGPNKSSTGGQIGLGLLTQYSENWDLRGEYTYNVFKKAGSLGTPRMDMVALSFVRKFGSCD